MKSFWPTTTVYISLFTVFLIIIPFMIDSFCMMLGRFTLGYTLYMYLTGNACIFLSGLLPLIMHNRYFSKNRSDIILSMPMNRKQAFLTEGIFGLLLITVLVAIGYLVGCTLCYILGSGDALYGTGGSSFAGLPTLFFACIAVYLSSVFAVSVSNSTFQAVCMIVVVNTIPVLVEALFTNPDISGLLSRSYNNYVNYWSSSTEVYNCSIRYIAELGSFETDYLPACYFALAMQMIVWTLLDILALFEFSKLKSEHLGTVIPQRFGIVNGLTVAYGLGFALMGGFFMEQIIYATGWTGLFVFIYMFALFLISFGYWITIFIVRKKARFRKDDWVRYAIAIGGGLILGITVYALMSVH